MNKPRLIDANEVISRQEIWVAVDGFPNYEVSNMGNVRNATTKKIRAIHPKGKYGHAQISLYGNGKNKRFQVHRLVALHFIPNPDNKPEVCHIDNTLNERGLLYNSVNNLMWGTHEENCQFWNTRKRQSENHADVSGANNPNYGKHLASEHKEKMMIERGKAVLQWENDIPIALYPSLKEAGRKTGISWSNIRSACNGEYKTAGGYEWSYACKPYDVEGVVEQLEALPNINQNYHSSSDLIDREDAIEIVRKGGVVDDETMA